MDDLDAVIRTGTAMFKSTWTEKISLVFARHNEHRIVLNKGLDLLQLTLSGQVNLKHQLMIGNCFLVAIFLITAYFYYNYVSTNWYLFLPAPLLIFNLKSYEAFLWPMVSIQTMGVILFALVSFIILFKRNDAMSWRRFLFAFTTAAIATYTCGNGFVTLLLGFAGLLTGRYPYKFSVLWLLLSVVLLGFYFQGYQQIAEHPKPVDAILTGTPDLLGHFFVLLGSPYWISGMFRLPVSIGAGFLTLSAILYYFIPKGLFKINPICFYFLLFLVLSCAITSLTRSGFGVHQAFSVRYHVYSLLTALFVYFSVLTLFHNKNTIITYVAAFAILGSSVSYSLARAFNLQAVKDMSFSLEYGSFSYYVRNRPAFAYPDQGFALRSIKESDSLGVYKYPRLSFDAFASNSHSIALPEPQGVINSAFDITPDENYLLIPDGWAFIDQMDYVNLLTRVILRNEERTLIYETHRMSRPDVSIAFHRDLENSGFSLMIKKDKIPDGIYDFGFYIRKITPFKTSKFALQFEPRRLQKKGNNLSWIPGPLQKAEVQGIELDGHETSFSVDDFVQSEQTVQIRGWAILRTVASSDLELKLYADSDKGRVEIPVSSEHRPDVSNALDGPYDNSGFNAKVPLSSFPSGRHELIIVLSSGNNKREISLNKSIIIP